MDLFLQLGYGMMGHCRDLITDWGEGTVILSPRDLKPDQLTKFASELATLGASCLLDPQFYMPHADHERLQSHSYWPDAYQSIAFWQNGCSGLLNSIHDLNVALGCHELIVPGEYATEINEDWLRRQNDFIEAAKSLESDLGTLATVALSSEIIRDLAQIHKLLDESQNWTVDGIYLILEHPSNQYIVEDPVWLASAIDLAAGFRMSGKKVILGYANHQMLIGACAAVNAIASGTWQNVRSFMPSKFNTDVSKGIKQRTTWYYCPQSLSEFTLPYLDLAAMNGVLNTMQPIDSIPDGPSNVLFGGTQPTSTGFTEKESFRHFLQTLKKQASEAQKATFDETVAHHENLLDSANSTLDQLHASGITGYPRDFKVAIQAHEGALVYFKNNRGPQLRRYWPRIGV